MRLWLPGTRLLMNAHYLGILPVFCRLHPHLWVSVPHRALAPALLFSFLSEQTLSHISSSSGKWLGPWALELDQSGATPSLTGSVAVGGPFPGDADV